MEILLIDCAISSTDLDEPEASVDDAHEDLGVVLEISPIVLIDPLAGCGEVEASGGDACV